MKQLSIGIDPGKITGLAIAEDGKITELVTTSFWEAYHYVSSVCDSVDVVVVEVPTTKKNWHGPKAAHDVGRVCRESELLADGIEKLGAKVIRRHPQGKLNQKQFTRITGWTKRTNQHCRDAAMLVYGANYEAK